MEFFGLGSAEDYQSITQDSDLWRPDKGFKVFAERVVFPIMETAYEIIAGFAPSNTILIAQGQFFAAYIAYEKLACSFITIYLQPDAMQSVHEFPLLPVNLPPLLIRGLFSLIDFFLLDKLFAPNINRFRQRLGLPAINKIFSGWMHSPQKNLCLFPDWFVQTQPDWPPQTQLTSFVYYDKQSENEELPTRRGNSAVGARYAEPIYLVSNMGSMQSACDEYRKRSTSKPSFLTRKAEGSLKWLGAT